MPASESFSSPRAWAFSLLGIDEYLRRFPSYSQALAARKRLVRALVGLWKGCATEAWPWFEAQLLRNYERVAPELFTQRPLSRERMLLIGSYFSNEYALESAALFNPSIVPHPDQSGLPQGALRFIMSLRTTGEGHVSSIEFRSGLIDPDGEVKLDAVSRFVDVPEVDPNPSYVKKPFTAKLREIGFDNAYSQAVMEALGESFALSDLNKSVARVRREAAPAPPELEATLRCA